MYSFEGDFRRRPQQNLAGASARHTLTRDELLRQAQQDRTKREEHKRRLNSTIRIQAHVRSFITRVRCKAVERSQFEREAGGKAPVTEVELVQLIRRLLFFYNQQEDSSRLIFVSQQLLKLWTKVLQCGGTYFQIRRLLALHLKLLNSRKNDSRDSLAVPLRMLEVFTSIESVSRVLPPEIATSTLVDTLLYLIRRGYFKELRSLLESRTPSLYGPSPNPPTPLAGSLLHLIVIPLQFVDTLHNVEYNEIVLRAFATSILCQELSEVVKLYVLPALKNNAAMPYGPLVWALGPQEGREAPVPYTMWLLYCVLYLQPTNFVQSVCGSKSTNFFWNPQIISYLRLVARLTENLCLRVLKSPSDESYPFNTYAGCDADSESDGDEDPVSQREIEIHNQCAEMLNSSESCILYMCSQAGQNDWNEVALEYISGICHNLLLSNKAAIHYKLTYTLAFKQWFLRSLWSWASSLDISGSSTSSSGQLPNSSGQQLCSSTAMATRGGTLLADLSQGIGTRAARLLPPLATFCSLYSLLLATLHDEEFANNDSESIAEETSPLQLSTQAFSLREVAPLCVLLRQVCTGLIDLAFPDQRPNVGQDYKSAVFSSDPQNLKSSSQQFHNQTAVWAHLFKVAVRLLRQLHTRDQRLHFTSGESDWCMGSPALPLLADRPHHLLHPRRNHRLRLYRPFAAFSALTREDCEDGPPLTTKEVRTLTILKEIPFVVPFSQRVLIFQGLIMKDKQEHQGDLVSFLQGPSIHIMIRRSHIYEDAFDKLSPLNEPDLRLKMRVQLMNEVGLEEAGVDGGGVFREFLSELLRTACDPNRGFFRLTRDNTLYPNPAVHLLVESFQQHYYFIGRMLGKALYEGLLVELPLAEFFLQALVGEADSGEADIHRLAALDERLHRSLLQLRALPPSAVQDLGLDFSVMSDELGEQRVEELKPGGSNIPVTAENRIEYIHLVAEWKLSRQVRLQTAACRQGLSSVVPLAWLRLFGPKELRLLVSGAESAVDVDDLKQHTNYGGGYSLDHPTIKFFWKVVGNFTDIQKRQLLKFVTSCSRPPLLGFKDLEPPFCIQHAGTSERLPSASTCMNLLKLPEFHSETTLREKLLYAINAGAGFELS